MKLTSILCLTTVCLTMGGCYYYDPTDRAMERAEKLAMKRAYQGCLFLDDHEAYRNCVITTLEQNSPKTFVVAENSNGDPVAIIKSSVPCDQNCPAGQTIVKTEVTKTITEEPVKKVIIIKPMGQVDMPKAQTIKTEEVVVQEVTTIAEKNTEQPQKATETEIETKEVTLPVKQQTETTPIVIKELPQPTEQPQEQTWWDKYQDNKTPEKTVTVKCPCEDPNDPCPECVEK